MTAARRIRRGVGAVVSLLVVAGTFFVVTTPWQGVERSTLSITTRPEPATSVLSCDGPIVAAGRDVDDPGALQVAAGAKVVSGTAAGSPGPVAGEIASAIEGADPIPSFSAEPVDRVRADLAAAQSARVTADDLVGFAASTCAPPAMETWLAAGSGLTGASDLVVIANPGDVAARVDLTVFGVDGRVAPEAGTNILVPAGEQRIVPLAALALGEASPVVLVSATQAPVHAVLQSTLTRTLVPVGVDQGGATGLPQTSQTIPAFSAVGGGDEPTDTTVRLLAPSDDTTASVTVTPVGGSMTAATFPDLALTAGVPIEVDLDSLPEGRYRVEVQADAPVVAAVHASTGADAGSDFAWYGTADDISVPTLVAVADGPRPQLALVNPGAEEVAAVLVDDAGAGEPREVRIPAGGSVSVDLAAGGLYRLDPAGGALRAGVTFTASDAIAGYAVVPADAAAAPVEVRPR
ncbi:DUF5719 family protein [Microbacterium sp. NPDC077663]|uniref:DUF5719 family protein n=1 Tax=Microbacterium sp. NPDC077663 TaxID=3364189 RepID=UPI0037CAA15B